MSKLKTISQLQESLDKSFSWRLKELADLKVSTKSDSSLTQTTLVRAGVTLLYAHWEGFVKQSSEDYLAYVANQRLNYGELSSCFIVFGAKKHVNTIISSRRAAANIDVVEFFAKCSTERANFSLSNAINTESNLSSTVFENIATSIGVSTAPYDAYFNLIDESLLNRRNRIAHGEYLDLLADEFRTLSDEVIKLLRMYKTDLENLASTGAFRC